MPQKDIIFIPDEYMGRNLKKLTSKNIILWKGRCVVHESFSPASVDAIREQFPGVKILAHTECAPSVIEKVDLAGGTTDMLKYVASTNADSYMIITECGLTDRIKTEFKDKKIVGSCSLCPYMKEISLRMVLSALKAPSKEQIIEISESVARKARKCLDMMYELEKKTTQTLQSQ